MVALFQSQENIVGENCILTEATSMISHLLYVNLMFLVNYMKEKHIHLNSLQWRCHMNHITEYILKVTISRNYVSNIVEYQDFVMEVGIEDCLHIEFEYSKSKYHLKDVIIGKIYFLLVRIKLKNMELEIRRRESTGSGPNTYVETETLAKFELMDGAPVRGTVGS
ncbi:Vacuolar sorting-associated protein 26A -like protein [Gossypium arboreum]|uniref:Vacuolar sorting-associated protein 26A-like protein n=1 Tax=Gossypium arboreum TaxID=29729 RepID=A0A0B0NJP9_GOSAR|nr:Vacuolar sorting-associated protein 26A -like protein [Gossypium arboreum]